MSKKPNNSTEGDCLLCRLISGFGVMGMGAYIYGNSNHRSKFQTGAMRFLAITAVGLGIARLFNLSFLKSKQKRRIE